jgi:hypothetical protein
VAGGGRGQPIIAVDLQALLGVTGERPHPTSTRSTVRSDARRGGWS